MFRRAFVCSVSALALFACGSGGEDSSNSGGAGSGAASDGGVDAAGSGGTGGSILVPDGSDGPGCSDDVRPVYVLTRDSAKGTIHRFDPATLSFTQVVKVDCPDTVDWGVSSMSVDRGYHAWVEWTTSASAQKRLDRIDLATGACQANVAALPAEWGTPLGMAFVSDAAGSAQESLFFSNNSTKLYPLGGAGPIGQFYAFQAGQGTEFSGVELTGTGQGRLFTMIMNWSFEWSHPCTAQDPCSPTVHLGEVNKLDGSAISNVEVPDVPALGISPGGIAFAHWGGHFWFFVSKDFGPTSVYDYDPVANATKLAKSDGPDGVVGAGVSTCAPVAIPK